jgi:hypothetical protein
MEFEPIGLSCVRLAGIQGPKVAVRRFEVDP